MADDIKTEELLRIWWCFFWRFVVGSFALSFVVGFVIGLVGTAMHAFAFDEIKIYAQIAGVVVTLFWGLCALLMALSKRYRGFRIVLVRGDLPLCRTE